MELITPVWKISPHKLNNIRKFYLSARKRDGRYVICALKLKSLAAVNELKTIIFVLNYLTVLVYTRTIIHLSGGKSTTSHLHCCSNFVMPFASVMFLKISSAIIIIVIIINLYNCYNY